MDTRRISLTKGLVLGAALFALCVWSLPAANAQLPGGSLDPLSVTKYQTPLLIPPKMPVAGILWDPKVKKFVDYCEIAVRQFEEVALVRPPDWAAIVTAEAGSAHWITACWRPLTMLIFAAIVLTFIGLIAMVASVLSHNIPERPHRVIETALIAGIVLAVRESWAKENAATLRRVLAAIAEGRAASEQDPMIAARAVQRKRRLAHIVTVIQQGDHAGKAGDFF